MLHQDNGSTTKSSHFRQVTQWLLSGIHWDKELHSSCTWNFRWLVCTALFWSWSPEKTLKGRFQCAQRLTIWLQSKKKTATSMQAFTETMARHTPYIRGRILDAFRKRMRQEFPALWKTYGFVIFGMDGSDVAVPRTRSNQQKFTTNGKSKHQKRKKKKTIQTEKLRKCPRILMTTIYHLYLGLPWDWRLGSKSDSERNQLKDMLGSLPEDALVVGDAGFVGYEFLAAIFDQGADLLVRVGSNVTLLKQLGVIRQTAGIVYIWPDGAAKKNLPPLAFRLVIAQGGRHPVYLITSVLDRKRLTDQQVVKIYRDRWDIELYHRHLKQTLGCRKMLSRNSENALIELQWALLGLFAMKLYATVVFKRHDLPTDQMSPAGIFQAFRSTARDYRHPVNEGLTLSSMIRKALKDQYERQSSKESRDYPRKRKRKAPGAPVIQDASEEQKALARKIKDQSLAA